MSVTDELVSAATAYPDRYPGGLPMPPARQVAVVACMDARIDVYRLFGLEEGQAHVIRNAGGVVTADVLRSLAISQRLLGTREVVLVHHTDCGMLTFSDDELRSRIETDTGIRPLWAAEAFADVEADLRQSAARVRAETAIPYRAVRGFVLDVADGRLREVDVHPRE